MSTVLETAVLSLACAQNAIDVERVIASGPVSPLALPLGSVRSPKDTARLQAKQDLWITSQMDSIRSGVYQVRENTARDVEVATGCSREEVNHMIDALFHEGRLYW